MDYQYGQIRAMKSDFCRRKVLYVSLNAACMRSAISLDRPRIEPDGHNAQTSLFFRPSAEQDMRLISCSPRRLSDKFSTPAGVVLAEF
jgi:hypothetical protein